MVVVLKRFGCDDVPWQLLDCDMAGALVFAEGAASTLTGKRLFATRKDQRIAQTNIGTECCALLLVEFDKAGDPVCSAIVNVPECKISKVNSKK